jgi:hypothetical protein
VSDLKRIIRKYLETPPDDEFGRDRVIPYRHLFQRCNNLAAFRTSRIGSKGALKNALDVLIDSGILRVVPKPQILERYGSTQACFVVVSNTL